MNFPSVSSSESLSDLLDPVRWDESLTLKIRHETCFAYAGFVTHSYNEARLHPWTDSGQSCLDFNLEIDPEASVREFPDVYDNLVQYIDLPQPHQFLKVNSNSVVQTQVDSRGPIEGSFPKSMLAESGYQIECYEFLQESPLIQLTKTLGEVSHQVLTQAEEDVWIQSLLILSYIHQHVQYQSDSTHVETRPEEVLTHRVGVCQDFAHLMIAMCRSQGIPARYVSGYFYHPERGPDEIEASHAWVEVFLPGFGWQGLDPTHRRQVDTRYVRLAIGRDYSDVRPLAGTYRGKEGASMSVHVKIQRIS